ncbi:MAG: hypothetical protein QM640_11155 [Niabella sp.]
MKQLLNEEKKKGMGMGGCRTKVPFLELLGLNLVIESLKTIARENGANVIKITKPLQPDSKSTYERIYADIYRVRDIHKHETEIE